MSVLPNYPPGVIIVNLNSPWYKIYNAAVDAQRSVEDLERDWGALFRQTCTAIFQAILRNRLQGRNSVNLPTLTIILPAVSLAEMASKDRFVKIDGKPSINRRTLYQLVIDEIVERLSDEPEVALEYLPNETRLTFNINL